MSFWDSVKKFAQPYADEEYDEYDEEMDEMEEEEEAAPRAPRRAPAFGGAAPAAPAPNFNMPPQQQPAPQGFTPPAAVNRAGAFNTAAPAAPAAPKAAPISTGFGMNAANRQEVVLFHAKAFDDAAKAADELRNRRAIILNMENVDKALTRRVVDFLSGCVYALDGKVKKIAQCTYLFCPLSMDIVGDLEAIKAEAENYV